MLASFPSPLVPPTVRNKDSDKHERGGGPAISLPGTGQGRGQGQVGNGVVSPSRVRLREDMWVSSRTFYVLDAEVKRRSGGEVESGGGTFSAFFFCGRAFRCSGKGVGRAARAVFSRSCRVSVVG